MSNGVGLVLVAAGSSRRMGETDKVWADLGGQPVICHALRRLVPLVDVVAVVIRPGALRTAVETLKHAADTPTIVPGGAERRHSVARGLEALPSGLSAIAIHDAARPFVPPALLTSGIALLAQAPGAVPALPLGETIKEVTDNRVARTVDRASLRAAQTPQVFRAELLRTVYATADLDAASATDDASLVEAAGLDVVTFPGAEQNFKITTPYDLEVARLLFNAGLVE